MSFLQRAQGPAQLPGENVEEKLRRARGGLFVGLQFRRCSDIDDLNAETCELAQQRLEGCLRCLIGLWPTAGVLARKTRRSLGVGQHSGALQGRESRVSTHDRRDLPGSLPDIGQRAAEEPQM